MSVGIARRQTEEENGDTFFRRCFDDDAGGVERDARAGSILPVSVGIARRQTEEENGDTFFRRCFDDDAGGVERDARAGSIKQ